MLIRKLVEGAGVECREGPLEEDAVARLHPAERAAIARAVAARQHEFATGRQFARGLLAALGIDDFALLGDDQRAPVWPEGIAGSIAHTRRIPGGYCAVVVGRKPEIESIGIDLEGEASLSERLWPKVLVDDERAWLGALPPQDRATAATLIWSAKESFYKLQFPITRRLLGYHAASVEVDEGAGRFQLRVRRAVGETFDEGALLEGRFTRGGGLVASLMVRAG